MDRGSLERLRSTLAGHRSHGPRRHRGQRWDCYFMEVSHSGEEIELAEVDFSAPALRRVFGVEIPVMPRDRLVACKRRLDRAVDRDDLAELDPGG